MTVNFVKTILRAAAISAVFFAAAACADPKAYDTYGMFDPSGATRDPSAIAHVNETLGRIYDDFGLSVFFCINYDSAEGAAADFYEYSAEPYLGDGIERGIVLGWAAKPELGRATDYGVISFPPEDGDEIERVYPFDFIGETIGKTAEKSPGGRDFFLALARELYERAKDLQ
jgi:hypothetical protein